MLYSNDASRKRSMSCISERLQCVNLRSRNVEKSVLRCATFALRIRETRVGEVRHGFD